MPELNLDVAGMTCRRCVREVTARLRDVIGVETVAADMGRSQVRLSGSMTFPDVVRAFVGTSYQPRIAADVVENRDTTEPGQCGQ